MIEEMQKAILSNLENIDKIKIIKGGEESRGGHVIGHTISGKPIYENFFSIKRVGLRYSASDHFEAATKVKDKKVKRDHIDSANRIIRNNNDVDEMEVNDDVIEELYNNYLEENKDSLDGEKPTIKEFISEMLSERGEDFIEDVFEGIDINNDKLIKQAENLLEMY